MMAVLELPPRLACSMRVSLLSLNGTWLRPCTTPCLAHHNLSFSKETKSKDTDFPALRVTS